MRSPAYFVCLLIGISACGPNVLSARGTVLHPMYKYKSAEEDPEAPRNIPRKLTISRKEPRAGAQHTIVGVAGKPRQLGYLDETAEMPGQVTDGSGLYVDIEFYSIYKDEMDLEKYEFWIELPDGRKVKGEVHRQDGIVNLSQQVDGRHTEYTVVKDGGQTTLYPHQVFVSNDFELFRRKGRIVFKTPGMLTLKTKYIVVVMEGGQRQRRWHFDFTLDPYKANTANVR